MIQRTERGSHDPLGILILIRQLTRNCEKENSLQRVLEDKVELGRRAERDVELRNPDGRYPFRKWRSSDVQVGKLQHFSHYSFSCSFFSPIAHKHKGIIHLFSTLECL